MNKVLDWAYRVWSKLEYPFAIGIAFFMLIANIVFIQLAAMGTVTAPWLWAIGATLIMSLVWSFRNIWVMYDMRNVQSLIQYYRDSYAQLQTQFDEAVKLCKDWQNHANDLKKKYFTDTETILSVNARHSEILPQQKAILSNLVENATHSSTIKSLLEFSNHVNHNTTVFLIRLQHDKAAWYFEVTGREIELEQALHILNGVEGKLRDFAGNNSLVKSTPKICN